MILTRSLQAQQPQGSPAVANRTLADAGNAAVPRAGGPQMANPMAPAWVPVSDKHQQYVDQILQYWQQKSDQVKRYRCKFKRWEYDPVFGPQETFKTFAQGVIKYSAPDKGLFRVEQVQQYQPPREHGGKPQYVEADAQHHEHWICDGKSIFEFDYRQKKLIERELPPEMRGKAIGKGPLPFLFNADASDIKRRFWIRVITPKSAQGEYWLEAVPKTQEDAANFKLVHVIIDEQDFMPKAMVLFDPNYQPQACPSRTSFQFEDREANFSILAQQLNIFYREFYEPKTPSGWEKIIHRWDQPALPDQSSGTRNQAAKQAGNARR